MEATTRHPLRAQAVIAALEAALADLASPDVAWPSAEAEHLVLVERARRLQSRLASTVAVIVADADRRGVAEKGAGSSMTTWLTVNGKATPREAANLIHAGKDLNAHPDVKDAALTGTVTAGQAGSIVTVIDRLPENLTLAQHERATALLLQRAETANPNELRRLDAVVLDAIAPTSVGDAAEREQHLLRAQRRRAHRRRSLKFHTEDGSLFFTGNLPVLEGEGFVKLIAAYHASDRRAGADQHDPTAQYRTPQQRQADALIRLVTDHTRGRGTPAAAGDRPRVVVIMREDSLRDRVEQAGVLGSGEPIPAGELRRLCCDADLTPAVLGSGSEVLDVGQTQRLVTPGIRRALSLRDGGCAFPGCDQPDEACEAHHILPWWNGGPTALDNLVLLCPHHHATVEPPRFFEPTPPTVSDAPGQRFTKPDGAHQAARDPGRVDHPPVSAPGPTPDRWEVRLDARGRPEFIPPARLDAARRPRGGETVARADRPTSEGESVGRARAAPMVLGEAS